MNTILPFNAETKGTETRIFDFCKHKVRLVVDAQGNPWFVAKDVCDVLEIGNPSKACLTLKEKHKGITTGDTLGGNQKTLIVNESGLYSLIFKSRKPSAEAFKDWVTEEVLPSIRKTGSYTIPCGLFASMTDVLGQSAKAMQVMAPKALFYDRYRETKGKHGLQATAKILHLKPNAFIQALLTDGLLFRRDKCLTAPEPLIKQGWFTTRLFEHPQTRMPSHQTMVTPKGLLALADRYAGRTDLHNKPQD